MAYTPLELAMLIKITPSEEEMAKAKELVKTLSAKVRTKGRNMGISVEPLLVGSLAKGTFLKDVDIDLFLLFKPDVSREDLQKHGLEIGYDLIPNGEERYAEHPYVHGWLGGYEIDVVPCYKLASTKDRMSAVDRTPFHTRYIKANLTDEQKNDILLLKRFMKGTSTYGAEASVGGFSGYLSELLVLQYGSFRGVLEGSRAWKKGTVLTLGEEPAKRFPEPLVFVDPVDSNRNVAAALTLKTIDLFQHASREYLSNPKKEFFFPNRPERTPAKEAKELFETLGTTPLLVNGIKPDLVDDVFYPQFLKMNKTLNTRCTDEGFPVLFSDWHVEKGEFQILLKLEQNERPSEYEHMGPPIDNEHAQRFLDKWEGKALAGPYILGDRWVVKAERELIISHEVVRDGLSKWAIGKDMAAMAARGKIGVYSGDDAIKKAFPLLLTKLLKPKMAWEW